MTTETKDRVVPGQGWASHILELYEVWKKLDRKEEVEYEGNLLDGTCHATMEEFLDNEVQQSPLSLQIRTDWHMPGSEDSEPVEYCLLLGTGGPAVRIIGNLGPWSVPVTATLQGQDWFTPWEDTEVSAEEQEAIQWYVERFYYGD